MVLVYGAAGLLGEEICRRLRQQSKRVRALLPPGASHSSRETLRRLNVELFVANLADLPTVAAACSGAESVICADPAMLPCRNGPALEAGGARCLVELASALRVREFVYVTIPENFETACALVSARKECVARLSAHRMNHVVLEAGFFMETWLSPELGFDYSNGKATVFGEGTQAVPWVSAHDVAELAIRSLGVDHHRKRHIQVASQDKMSPLAVVGLFEETRAEPLSVTRIPEADLRAELKRTGDPAARIPVAMKVEFARGIPMRGDYDEIPITLASVRDYVSQVTGTQVGSAGSN